MTYNNINDGDNHHRHYYRMLELCNYHHHQESFMLRGSLPMMYSTRGLQE